MTDTTIAGSFRDPCGFVFRDGEVIYRQVNDTYREHYERLMQSGLYEKLVDDGLLVRHDDLGSERVLTPEGFTVLRPERIPFISYPYEWSFSELRDAALLTLDVQKQAFEFGMTLKDASAFNVQFVGSRPVFIDTLSFEKYAPGQVWIPYRQFCQHFLAPLALMTFRDPRLGQMLRLHMDGIPLDLASSLLPVRTRFVPGLFMHLHLHAGAQRRWGGGTRKPTGSMGKTAFRGLIDSLHGAIRGLRWKPGGTEWADYYDGTNYSREAFEEKQAIVGEFLANAKPTTVWDLGSNTGLFSRIAARGGALVASFDVDPSCVENNYLQCRRDGETRILPLLLDLTNPSPSLGWALAERESIRERAPVDLVMALALIHHLAISNNVPLPDVARTLSGLGRYLIIEFVAKDDSQVRRLLSTRADIFPHYHRDGFEGAFRSYYDILAVRPTRGTARTLYLMRRKP